MASADLSRRVERLVGFKALLRAAEREAAVQGVPHWRIKLPPQRRAIPRFGEVRRRAWAFRLAPEGTFGAFPAGQVSQGGPSASGLGVCAEFLS
jgi:hypothetical protein